VRHCPPDAAGPRIAGLRDPWPPTRSPAATEDEGYDAILDGPMDVTDVLLQLLELYPDAKAPLRRRRGPFRTAQARLPGKEVRGLPLVGGIAPSGRTPEAARCSSGSLFCFVRIPGGSLVGACQNVKERVKSIARASFPQSYPRQGDRCLLSHDPVATWGSGRVLHERLLWTGQTGS